MDTSTGASRIIVATSTRDSDGDSGFVEYRIPSPDPASRIPNPESPNPGKEECCESFVKSFAAADFSRFRRRRAAPTRLHVTSRWWDLRRWRRPGVPIVLDIGDGESRAGNPRDAQKKTPT